MMATAKDAFRGPFCIFLLGHISLCLYHLQYAPLSIHSLISARKSSLDSASSTSPISSRQEQPSTSIMSTVSSQGPSFCTLYENFILEPHVFPYRNKSAPGLPAWHMKYGLICKSLWHCSCSSSETLIPPFLLPLASFFNMFIFLFSFFFFIFLFFVL